MPVSGELSPSHFPQSSSLSHESGLPLSQVPSQSPQKSTTAFPSGSPAQSQIP